MTRLSGKQVRGREPIIIIPNYPMGVQVMSVFVGIDIAAKSVDVVARSNNKSSVVKSYEQTPQGHKKLADSLLKLQPTCVVMEATGIYYLNLAIVLHDAGINLSVINPKSFNHFAKLTLTNSKTDDIDAALLAEYAQRMTPKMWKPPSKGRLQLRDISRQINRLTHDCTKSKNRLHALLAYKDTNIIIIEDEREGIEQLTKRIKRLHQLAIDVINADEFLKQKMENLTTAKGIGPVSAVTILGELMVLPDTLKANQVSRFAGLDVRLNQSGTSLNKPGRLSKAGNAYLRSALFMPALSALQHDPNVKAFHDALVARGKKKIQAVCAVMRKYLTGIWACLQSNTHFDSSKLFSEIHKQACV